MKYIFIIIIILLILIAFAIYLILLHNKISKLEINIQKEYSNIDVNLNKRSDLIPNLVEVVKKFMHHEEELLTNLVKARNDVINSKKNKEKIVDADNYLTKCLNDLFIVVENYPNLKSSENFLQLQKELYEIEAELATTRINYNNSVQKYDNVYSIFPAKLFVNLMGYKKYKYFEIKQDEREMPEINFD